MDSASSALESQSSLELGYTLVDWRRVEATFTSNGKKRHCAFEISKTYQPNIIPSQTSRKGGRQLYHDRYFGAGAIAPTAVRLLNGQIH